jgi:class 3 adenylate cyclase
MKGKTSTFKPNASFPQQAIVVIFDLEGFSNFFCQPDVQQYVPKYLNHVLEVLNIVINGGENYWGNDIEGNPGKIDPLPKPIHTKFLGDGVLYIWKYDDFKQLEIVSLINRLWNVKVFFNKVVEKAAEVVPVTDIPKRIRFGIAAGSVYKLTYQNSTKEEYIGYSINLASRLQGYCREIGFIISARVNINSSELTKHAYAKSVAKKLKGFPREIVVVDNDDYNNLDEKLKLELFDEL